MCQTFGKKKNNINTIVKGTAFVGNCGKGRKLAKEHEETKKNEIQGKWGFKENRQLVHHGHDWTCWNACVKNVITWYKTVITCPKSVMLWHLHAINMTIKMSCQCAG